MGSKGLEDAGHLDLRAGVLDVDARHLRMDGRAAHAECVAHGEAVLLGEVPAHEHPVAGVLGDGLALDEAQVAVGEVGVEGAVAHGEELHRAAEVVACVGGRERGVAIRTLDELERRRAVRRLGDEDVGHAAGAAAHAVHALHDVAHEVGRERLALERDLRARAHARAAPVGHVGGVWLHGERAAERLADVQLRRLGGTSDRPAREREDRDHEE